MKFHTKEELLEYTENIKGKTFKEIDSEHLLDKNKSNISNILLNTAGKPAKPSIINFRKQKCDRVCLE